VHSEQGWIAVVSVVGHQVTQLRWLGDDRA
jgi:hypothetical protein